MDNIGKRNKIQRTRTTGDATVETVKDVRRLRKTLRKAEPNAPAPGSEGGRSVMRIKVAESGSFFSHAGEALRPWGPDTTGNRLSPSDSRRTRRPAFVPRLDMAHRLHESGDGMTRIFSSSESDTPIVSPRRAIDEPDPLFGLDPEKLQQQRALLQSDFDRKYDFARKHQTDRIGRKNYVEVQELVPSEEGQLQRETQWVRSEKTYAERFLEHNAETEKKIQTGFNRMKRVARSLTHSPRRTGSNYASDKPMDELLSLKKMQGVLGTLTTQTATRLDFGIAGAAGAAVPGAANALPLVGVVAGGVDAVQAARAAVQLHSSDADIKAQLRHLNDAERFLRFLWAATPKEAKHYLQFDQAARQLLEPTKEERAARASLKDDILNRAVVLPPMTLASTGVQIAGMAVTTSATAAAGAALSPLGIASSAIDIHQGKQEQKYRREQIRLAKLRKAAMSAVVAAHAGHPKHALLAGIVASLSAGQDRLLRDASAGKAFGKFREIRGAVSIPLTTGATVATGLVLGGVATALTGGIAGAVATVPILVLLGVLTNEVHRIARVEHKAKWRQRAAQVIALDTPRDVLEQMLAGTHPGGSTFRLEIREGDYLAEFQTFAGVRLIELDVLENEYVGLHALALQIHDLVTGEDRGDVSPFLDLLEALGMHSVMQLAVCKAASGEPSIAQRDFIQNHLARTCMGMTFRMAGPMQALPHVSVFLRHYGLAWMEVVEDSKLLSASQMAEGLESEALKELVHSDRFLAAVRSKLVARYVNPKEGLAAFMQRSREFLHKTWGMSHPARDLNLWNELQRFCDYQQGVEQDLLEGDIKRKKTGRADDVAKAPEIQQAGRKLAQSKKESEAKAQMEASSRAAVIARETRKIEKHPALAKSLPASNRAPAKMPKIDRRINSWSDVSGESEGEKEALLKTPRTPKTNRRFDD
ncbi:hypothetical protein [Variovorax sp. PBL-E5]|uniref:hypothetical protein n=1 Tax=Variovorax sp. PBL-E5 TaxID=434014 RepID=UPI001315BF0E|nr:hypothetical protein [Variovorax sp. PBL-E5]VTU23256.1 hypothetical protein E5CHR_01554 [Variovorax sp. PBL-E5]